MNTNICYAEKPLQSGNNPWWVVRYNKDGAKAKKGFWRIEEAWQFYAKICAKNQIER